MTSSDPIPETSTTGLARVLAWIWAVVTLVLGMVASFGLVRSIIIGRTKFGPGPMIYFGACTIVFVIPSVLYILLAALLPRRQRWVVTGGLIVSLSHAACALIGLIGLSLLPLFFDAPPLLLLPMGGAVVYLAGCLHMAWVLRKCYRELSIMDGQSPRGFSPVGL